MDVSVQRAPGRLKSFAKRVISLLPKRVQKKLFGHYWAMTSPDRVFLVNEILPAYAALRGTVLWIGCERYTKKYPAILEKNGGICWTIEINPQLQRWGSPRRHIVGDLLALDELLPEIRFDTILCNGIFGFGVNTQEQQAVALARMEHALKPGGLLLLSWNSDRTPDPVAAGLTASFEPYAPSGLLAHYAYPNSTHVYELLRKRATG